MFPIGLVNVIRDGILHPAVYFDDMLFTNISFRSGSRYFYSIFGAGANIDGFERPFVFSYRGDTLLSAKYGIGFEMSLKKFFINVDLLGGSIVNLDTINDIKASDYSIELVYNGYASDNVFRT